MGKLVRLRIGEGSFEQGFPVILEIADEGAGSEATLSVRWSTETPGKLPPAPDLPEHYQRWQSSYYRLGLRTRLNAPQHQNPNVSVINNCLQAAQQLRDRLNQWARSEPFRPVREKWFQTLSPTDRVRVILQTDDYQLQRLPWHLLDLFEDYPNAEIALSAPRFSKIQQETATVPGKVRILAILGNSEGIDTQADRNLLDSLPQAEVTFLVEPHRKQLTDQLWAQPWDILFFAGHSSSQGVNETGQIAINQSDRLTIEQLKHALRAAIARGLKLAIFNSCDGLGLARELADLQIPQIVVMREPVPDRVAQEFLTYFLTAFSHGESFYLSVRHAREQLQALEDEFLFATWLPVICQNPAELPPTWQSLMGQPPEPLPLPSFPPALSPPAGSISPLAPQPLYTPRSPRRWWPRLRQAARQLRQPLAIALATTAVLTAGRSLGLLQPLELAAYDQMLRLRPAAASQDNRILLVTIGEAERQQYGQTVQGQRYSLSNETLNQLLQTLTAADARLIGLDLYRDLPIERSQAALAQQFRQNSRIIGICKARYKGNDSISPPPGLPGGQVGFSDFVPDVDGKVRRHLLAFEQSLVDPNAPCTSPYSFSYVLAANYLARQQSTISLSPAGALQLADREYPRLQQRSGGYQASGDMRGVQLLLNYRTVRYPETSPFDAVSLSEVLSGAVLASQIQDRLVLVGVTEGPGDIWRTPLQPDMPGVIVQAHMTSQLLSAALEGRSLLWVGTLWQETLLIGLLALAGSLLGRHWRSPLGVAAAGAIAMLLTGGFCLWVFSSFGGWLPVVPMGLSVLLAMGLRSVGSAGAIARSRRWRRAL